MTDNSLLSAVVGSVDPLLPELVEIRRDLHAHPELSREETRTTLVVSQRLAAAGVRVRPLAGTGLVADIGAEQPAYRVALRADLDALPVRERTNLEWASTNYGVCHACGHDVHVTSVLGAGLALRAQEERLREQGVAARLIFQPAEEVIPGGAIDVLEQGGMEGVDAVFAVHCDPSIEVGRVGLREGPITAASDRVTVHLSGRGGHTSRPHLTEDLTFALAKVITEVPAVLSRRLDPRSGLALVWGEVRAGMASNVIPSSGIVAGTLRMLDAEAWKSVGPLLEQVVHAVVSPYAVTARLEHVPGVPPVVNHPDAVDVLRQSCVGGGLEPVPTPQSLGGEDFAWYLTSVPGAMARLGTRTPGGRTYDLHQGDLVVDEGAVAAGARLLAGAVVADVIKAAASGDTAGKDS
ncbi:amidohydrolase [Phycicoccus sp. SLBN-51]|uniref:amidohydrolase n=1 Tax=Phycicoccus sp. SLBN-51 TaxID=2768447 RepID=UPI00114F615E|nr:amidohydrolase [Phycicoccus sp. SLBN-51]TQJ51875.1 amidohydrolase [Phycicoccus sp. SLBN-51]